MLVNVIKVRDMNGRIETTVELERWNESGTQCWDEKVVVVGTVDLEADEVELLETHPHSLDHYGCRDQQEMKYALAWAAHAKQTREKELITNDLKQLAVALSGAVAL